MNVKVSGDAEHGWMVEVHDGDVFRHYSPEAADEAEAEQKALAMFAAERTARDEKDAQPSSRGNAVTAELRQEMEAGDQVVIDHFEAEIERLSAELKQLKSDNEELANRVAHLEGFLVEKAPAHKHPAKVPPKKKPEAAAPTETMETC